MRRTVSRAAAVAASAQGLIGVSLVAVGTYLVSGLGVALIVAGAFFVAAAGFESLGGGR